MTEAFLHCQQDVGVAARLDMDHAIGMQSREMQRRRKQIAPAEAPEDRAVDSREDAGEEDRGTGVVGQIDAARDFMKGAGRQTTAREIPIERIDAERNGRMPRSGALDLGDASAQFGKGGRFTHGSKETREAVDPFPICSLAWLSVNRPPPRTSAAVRSRNQNRLHEFS